MDLLKTASLVILFILAPVLASNRTRLIIKRPGEDGELQCQVPEGREVQLLECTRPDLPTGLYVFLYRQGRVLDHFHHPSFSNRVQLRDPELKTGNLSVVLKNVTRNDTGMYRCFALFETSEGQEISQDTWLIVTEPEQKAKQHSGGGATASPGPEPGSALAVIVIVTVVVLLLLIAGVTAGVIILYKKTNTKQSLWFQ